MTESLPASAPSPAPTAQFLAYACVYACGALFLVPSGAAWVRAWRNRRADATAVRLFSLLALGALLRALAFLLVALWMLALARSGGAAPRLLPYSSVVRLWQLLGLLGSFLLGGVFLLVFRTWASMIEQVGSGGSAAAASAFFVKAVVAVYALQLVAFAALQPVPVSALRRGAFLVATVLLALCFVACMFLLPAYGARVCALLSKLAEDAPPRQRNIRRIAAIATAFCLMRAAALLLLAASQYGDPGAQDALAAPVGGGARVPDAVFAIPARDIVEQNPIFFFTAGGGAAPAGLLRWVVLLEVAEFPLEWALLVALLSSAVSTRDVELTSGQTTLTYLEKLPTAVDDPLPSALAASAETAAAAAAGRVLSVGALWSTITDFMPGLPFAVLAFEKRVAGKYRVREGAAYKSSVFFELDEIDDWFPKRQGWLPHLAIAEDSVETLRVLVKLRRSAHYRADPKLDVRQAMRCAIWFKRWRLLPWLARVLPTDAEWRWEPELLSYAVVQRNFPLMNWLTESCPRESVALSARRVEVRECGDLEMVRWLHDHQYTFSVWMMNGAAAKGSLEVVEFLHRHRGEGCTTAAMDLAARYGHLRVLEFLHANRAEGCTSSALDGAAQNGHLNVVKFLLTSRAECCVPTSAIRFALDNNHLEVAEHLRGFLKD
ncbi:hypothetical protein PybrP1_010491 [[Pythium] brassicae (nom. inval.)]|nr:hypothetical protein PybrP1_010491 [[Pythium] brassicae (nom. inval.)]